MSSPTLYRTALRSLVRTFSQQVIDAAHLQQKALNEKCFLVDENDNVTGVASKRDCHLVQPDGDVLLHRAFSVFLFNENGDILLQKRSSEKITYPDRYTNACCSHPIADYAGEEEEQDAMGVKRAARRRLNYELGIPLEEISLDHLQYITRIHYMDEGDGKWGEHEIDYVLFLQGQFNLDPNPSEVSEISFVPKKAFDEHLPTLTGMLTPWFKLIVNHRLKFWWERLNKLEEIRGHQRILRFKK